MLQDDDAYFDGGAARLAFGIPPPPKTFQYSETPCHSILCRSKQYNDSYLKSFATGQSLWLN
jgi:hypothetical protein